MSICLTQRPSVLLDITSVEGSIYCERGELISEWPQGAASSHACNAPTSQTLYIKMDGVTFIWGTEEDNLLHLQDLPFYYYGDVFEL